MSKKPHIAEASGIAVTHRPRDDRNGDYRVADNVRMAMEAAAKEAMAANATPDEVKAAIDSARKAMLGINEA